MVGVTGSWDGQAAIGDNARRGNNSARLTLVKMIWRTNSEIVDAE